MALVEDHDGTRQALAQLVLDFPAQLSLAGAFADAASLLKVLDRTRFDVALVDLRLPGMTGHALIEELGTRAPHVRCVALTAFDSEQDVIDAVRVGAYGYLLKDEPQARIVQAIADAAVGAHSVSSRVAGFLFAHTRRAPAPVALSDREEELATLLASGLSYAESAERMKISVGTVQDYVKRLYRKLDVNTKKEVREWVARYVSKGRV